MQGLKVSVYLSMLPERRLSTGKWADLSLRLDWESVLSLALDVDL